MPQMTLNSLLADRRKRLMQSFSPGTVLIVPSAHHVLRNGDVDHAWRQDSDFWFLTGFNEPDSVLVLSPGRAGEEVVLFVRPRDKDAEIWNGRRAGLEGAVATHGAEKAYLYADFEKELGRLCENTQEVAWVFGRDAAFDQVVLRAVRRHRTHPKLRVNGPDRLTDLSSALWPLRLFKQPEEIEALRQASEITAEAHHEAMRLCEPGRSESQLQAALEYVFLAGGGERVGYGSIVASGDNATILHYTENNMLVQDGALVLVDGGCEVDQHTADVTRTFPANGTFSEPQRAVYNVVLSAQLAAIDACRVGKTFHDVHDLTIRSLTEGMVRLGLLRGEVDTLIKENTFKKYYMHGTSHWLGLDVHDVGGVHDVTSEATPKASKPLQPGMVLTIEPGLYIASDDADAPEAYRGIGVRIEDDVLVTADGPDVLTRSCVKLPDEVEAMVREAPRWVKPVVI
jgi:Xaa-Pro aminopeptidase